EALASLGLLAEAGAAFVSQGRRAVRNAQVLRRALTYARAFGLLVDHQPHDPDLVGDGVMNEGEVSTRLGLPGIPREAETIMAARDVALARLTDGRLHLSGLTCADSLAVLRAARRQGLDVTGAASINHLALNENDIGAYRTFFKMMPPLRAEDDRQALVEGLADGTLDILVSAHDPQDADTKRHPFAEAADGAVGLETLLSVGLRLVEDGSVPLRALLAALTINPARRLGLPQGRLAKGAPADLILVDLGAPYVLDADALRSRSKNTPFDKARLQGRVMRSFVAGQEVFARV
ncbi:MAG: amidohydrolase family protein, partial [Pseudomonadota bacterium]